MAAIAALALLSAVAPLATDMYLPAFPVMAEQLGASAAGIQVTLTAFLAGLAGGQLLIGPLSDRFGRRKPLLAGTALAHRMARFGPPRQTAESFWPVLVARLFEGWPLVAFITFCTAASLAVLWPGLAEYAATGHVQMHWSRLVTGTFGLVVASQGVVAGILMRVLDIWQIQAVHKSSRAQRHATGGSRGKP